MAGSRDDKWSDPPVLDQSVEPKPPLVEEARWTSRPVAEQLLLDSRAFHNDWSGLHVQPPYAIYHY